MRWCWRVLRSGVAMVATVCCWVLEHFWCYLRSRYCLLELGWRFDVSSGSRGWLVSERLCEAGSLEAAPSSSSVSISRCCAYCGAVRDSAEPCQRKQTTEEATSKYLSVSRDHLGRARVQLQGGCSLALRCRTSG